MACKLCARRRVGIQVARMRHYDTESRLCRQNVQVRLRHRALLPRPDEGAALPCRNRKADPGLWNIDCANVEEARAPASRRDLRYKFVLALKEARETKFWLRLIRATELAPAKLTDGLLRECDELVAIFTVSVRNLDG